MLLKEVRILAPIMLMTTVAIHGLAFSPTKKIPSVFVMSGNEETITNPVIVTRGANTLLGVPVDKRFVLRPGKQVVGIENKGFGKVRLQAADTVSP